MTSQPRKQTIAIHILPNIARTKVNQIVEALKQIKQTFLEGESPNLSFSW